MDKAQHFDFYSKQSASAQEIKDTFIQHMPPDTILWMRGIVEILKVHCFLVIAGCYIGSQRFCGIRLAYITSFHYSNKCQQVNDLMDDNSRKTVGLQRKDVAAKHRVFPLFICLLTAGYQKGQATCKTDSRKMFGSNFKQFACRLKMPGTVFCCLGTSQQKRQMLMYHKVNDPDLNKEAAGA